MKVAEAGLALGRQMTLELYECDAGLLSDAPELEKRFVDCARKAGATVIGSYFHSFEPQGVSGVIIIAESHFTVHAWPEHDYAAVDVFSCSDKIDFDRAAKLLGESLGSRNVVISSLMNRGVIGNDGSERLVPVFNAGPSRFPMAWRQLYESCGAPWGVSVMIDVAEIAERFLRDSEAVGSFADDFFAGMSFCRKFDSCELGTFSDDNGGGLTLRCRCGADYLTGRFVRRTGGAYLDVFRTGFFEPRTAAELADRLLGGRSYRMQVSIRH